MEPTRISIARVLALDVPLTWQDAVAVAQEAAMLSEVGAAMDDRPALVSPEACFVDASGHVDLPASADTEDPDRLLEFLRAMLAGREAPPALEALARRTRPRDLSEKLAAFDIGNRRARIGALATRALAAPVAPTTSFPATLPSVLPPESLTPATPAPPPPAEWVAPVPRADAPPAESPPAAQEGRISAIPTAGHPPAPPIPLPSPTAPTPPPFVAKPAPAVVMTLPFVATPARGVPPALDVGTGGPGGGEPLGTIPDAELQRLRSRTVERGRRALPWSARAAQWLSWRPAFPDPRLLGGAAVVVAAVVSVVWREAPDDAGASDDRVAPLSAPPAAPSLPVESAGSGVATPLGPPAAPVSAGEKGERASPRPILSRPSRPDAAAAVRPATTPTEERPAPVLPGPGAASVASPPLPTTSPSAAPAMSIAPASESPRRPAAAGRAARGRTTPYSADDAEVAPPVMVRQQLPSALLEGAAEPSWPFLELLIDEQGAVEQVRLRAKTPAPGQTLYRHRMLLAAAKAWQFEPARLNGQPVRYVMRVPLEP